MSSVEMFLEVKPHPERALRCFDQVTIEEDIICVGGSLAEGFGNATSDIDVYAITQRDIPVAAASSESELVVVKPQAMIRNIVADGHRFDIEYHRESDIVKLLCS